MKNIDRLSQKVIRNLPLIMGIWILSMDLVAIFAPVLAFLGMDEVAHIIYKVYSFLCHQRPWRSIHLFDYQVAWCSRDTFIYLSMGLSAIFVKLFKIRDFKWYIAVLSIIPFALDGSVQMVAEISGVLHDNSEFFYASTNFIRMLTGSIFGAGAGLWLFSLLDETIDEEIGIEKKEMLGKDKKGVLKKNLKYYFLIMLICLISYIGFVQLWNITSDKYKPYGLLDHKRYFPGVNYEEVERGGHGL